MKSHEVTMKVMDLLGRLRAATTSAEEQELLAVAIDAILFITSTGQRYPFIDYHAGRESEFPPPVVASFQTRTAAEAWLKDHPAPPDGTHVLIAGQYHHVTYSREMNFRSLVPSPAMEGHIAYLTSNGLPAPVATFSSHAEAEAWLASQSHPRQQAFILIAGQHYLAVFYPNIDQRLLYPVPRPAQPTP